jgi:DNA-binding response OmpR family regulator
MSARILIVDDDPAMVDSMVRVLKHDGYHLDIASDGEQALRRVLAEPPDLILLDVGLPHISGWEICEIVRRQTHTREVPVLFVTGRADVRDHIFSMQAGGSDHLSKPFQADELRAKVRGLLCVGAPEVARGL